MQTEHLSNLHPGWVVGGWVIAVSITAAAYLGGVGLGLVQPGSGALGWLLVSLFTGFFGGGLVVGFRWTDAPILHGAAIGVLSMLVWFLAALLGDIAAFDAVETVLGLLLLQLLAAILGGWTGRRLALGGSSVV